MICEFTLSKLTCFGLNCAARQCYCIINISQPIRLQYANAGLVIQNYQKIKAGHVGLKVERLNKECWCFGMFSCIKSLS